MSLVIPSKAGQNYSFLDLNGVIFTTGQPIHGVAAIVLRNELQGVKRIYLKWEGLEQTGWTKPNNEQVSAERLIFSKYDMLWTPESEVDDRILEPGAHSWNINWMLPTDIPASFYDHTETQIRSLNAIEDTYGYVPHSLYKDRPNITYSVELVVETDVPAHSASLKLNRTFRVTQRLDSTYAKMEPLSKQIDRTFLFTKGVLNFKVILPKGPVAFRGRNLPLRVEIQNGPKKKLDTITMTVHQNIIFNAKGEMQQRRNSAFMGVTTALEDQTSEPPAFVYRDLLLNIPNDTEPSITLGTLIQRHYELTVDLSVFMGTTASVSLPIQMYDPNQLDLSILSHFPPSGNNRDAVPEPVSNATPEERPAGEIEQEFNGSSNEESVVRRKKKEEKKNVLSLLAPPAVPTVTPASPQDEESKDLAHSVEGQMKRSPSHNSLSNALPRIQLEEKAPRLQTSLDHISSRGGVRASVNNLAVARKKHSRSASLQISPSTPPIDVEEMKRIVNSPLSTKSASNDSASNDTPAKNTKAAFNLIASKSNDLEEISF